MDVERAIEFILDQQAKTAEEFMKVAQHLSGVTEKLEGVTEKLDGLTEKVDRLADRQLQSEREIGAVNDTLRRAIKIGVREARAERNRRQHMESRLDEKITQLAAAQLVTEEKLQNFIDSLGRSTNGGSQKN